jgi:hypothetical protein
LLIKIGKSDATRKKDYHPTFRYHTRRISGMKLTHLKRLAPVVLEEIKKIEIENSQPQKSVESAQSSEDQIIYRFAEEAQKACQRWNEESKPTFPKDVLPAIEFFLIVIAVLIRKHVISEISFNRQKTLLDLCDRLLECRENPVDVACIHARLAYYKAFTYLIQKENEVDIICTYLQECATFSYDSPTEQCLQIDMLDTLCLACVTWMSGAEREFKMQDKISILTSQIVYKLMDVYDGIPFSFTASSWDPARVYAHLVARAVGSALRHFLEIHHNRRKESVSRHRVENLMTRLQTFISKHSHLTPPENEYRLAFNMITELLKTLNTEDNWLEELMLNIAETFALQIKSGSHALDYQTEMTTMRKPVMEKPSDQKMTLLSSVKRTDSLQAKNVKLQQQLREIEQASKQQQRDLQEKNKLLQQRLKKGVKEKSDFERQLKSKESEILSLIDKNTQLKTQLTEVKDQETTLQQKQNQISAELQQIIAEQEQQTVEHKQQESKWTQRLREQQMALHSVSAEKRRLETAVTSSQSTVQQLKKKLNQTNTQLTETQEDIERQASYKALDQAETYKTVQALQGEIDRLRRLLSLQTPSMRGDNRFTFS